MLRREADGVRWWLDRRALRGAAVAPPALAAVWTSRDDPPRVVEQAHELVGVLETTLDAERLGAERAVLNGYWAGGGHDAGRWNEERRRRILGRVAEPDGGGFDFGWEMPDPPHAVAYRWASSVTFSAHAHETDGLWTWTVRASEGLLRGDVLDMVGEAWFGLLRVAAGWPGTLWGAVLHDHWNADQPLPYERYFGIEVPTADTGETAPGYYWANLLTAGHLARLGGLDTAARRSQDLGLQFHPVHPIAPDAGRAASVRADGPISALDDARLTALRDLLAPALVSVPYRFYGGPPLRVLKEPGTAFRRIPPEIAEPWFDDDPPLTPEMGPAFKRVPD